MRHWPLLCILFLASCAHHAPMTDTPPPLRPIRELADLDLSFTPAVFTGDAFPVCDFENPKRAREILGDYTLTPTFYDADHNPTTRPTRPGRYGARVAITSPAAPAIPARLVTLLKAPAAPDWNDIGLSLTLPPQLGLNPGTLAAQQKTLSDYARERVTEYLRTEPDTAVLLAALSESKPNDPPLAGRNSIWAKDQKWWLPLKQKLGVDEYKYLHHLPQGHRTDGTEKYPLLLYLHGSGERGDDLERLKANGIPKLAAEGKTFPFIVIAPQCPAGEWWSAPQLRKLLERSITEFHADPDRIYVTGLSMGGYGAWELADEYPGLFAAIVPICGAGAPHDAARVKHVPACLFHGLDDTVVSPRHSIEMYQALKAAGADPRLTLYPDTGHDAWSQAYNDAELYEWLLKQRRH